MVGDVLIDSFDYAQDRYGLLIIDYWGERLLRSFDFAQDRCVCNDNKKPLAA